MGMIYLIVHSFCHCVNQFEIGAMVLDAVCTTQPGHAHVHKYYGSSRRFQLEQ